MKALRKAISGVDGRDVAMTFGLSMLGFGLDRLLPGLGFAAVGAVLVYIALR